MKSLRYVSVFLILFLILVLKNDFILKANAEATVVYDFIEYASKAQWSSGAGALPFPGDPSDKRGFACYVYNAVLEDGTKWSKVLETHPEWKSEGWIMGVYPQQIVKPYTQLIIKVGFLSGATGTDGVRFDVYFDEYSDGTPIRHTILRQWASLDGKLDTLIKDLSFIAGKKGSFILYVSAGKTSNRDWAVWAEAKIETIPLPDLIITDIWQKDNRIYYKIKNIGDANAAYFFNVLFIDDKNVAKDYINTIIEPGKEIERYFDYDWHATLPKHVIKVCADYGNKVIEKDEGNNCREETWYLKLPDLVIIDIWENNSLIHYKVKNVGDAATSKSFQNCLSIDGKQVATHVITQVLQPGQEVEGVFDYVWQPAPGEHFVKVCADCKQEIQESNEENNCLEEKWIKENLPDLIIIEIKCDRSKSLIGYVIKNIGSEVAKGNHSTVLYVDGIMITRDFVGVDLKPGETFESWFKDYEWPECRNITVKVRADDFDQVRESNEFNNALEKICISYPIPITIVSGPSVVNITQDSATIVWTTNKKSDSYVEYSERLSGGWNTIHDHNKVVEHVIKITGLKPRTTYMFIASSRDDCGNLVTTNRTMVFETAPPPDDKKPWVRLIIPDTLRFSVDIMAEAGDDVGVEGVSFLVDGVFKFMALSPPRTQARYVWACDTRLLPNGPHVFSVVAFDAAGNTATDVKNVTIDNPMADLEPPIVRIVKPTISEVNGLFQIEAVI
ncbi:MAG: CARDB domain-containing protein, partial [Nitrososphaerota archaeon]